MRIYEDDLVYIETEESEIPRFKIFTREPYKEFSQTPANVKEKIWQLLDTIEKEMLSFYTPDKINIASFGNYVPHVHFHIMARFKNDSFFPEPMWGKKQREGTYRLTDFDTFIKRLQQQL